jgi:hypothetical protein
MTTADFHSQLGGTLVQGLPQSTARHRMARQDGDKYRFSDGPWEYLTAGQDNWEPVRFPGILTDFGPYTAVADS